MVNGGCFNVFGRVNQAQGRVAQQRKIEFVDCVAGCILGVLDDVAETGFLSVFHFFEDIGDKGAVELEVEARIDHPGGGQQGDAAPVGVKENHFSCRYTGGMVVATEFAGSGDKKRQAPDVGPFAYGGGRNHLFGRKASDPTMSYIIEKKGALLQAAVNHVFGIGRSVALGAAGFFKIIEVDFSQVEAVVVLFQAFGQDVCIAHVNVVVAVVCHKGQQLAPVARILVLQIGPHLIHRNLGIDCSANRKAAYPDVELVEAIVVSFVRIEEAKVVVGDVTVGAVYRIFALIGWDQ